MASRLLSAAVLGTALGCSSAPASGPQAEVKSAPQMCPTAVTTASSPASSGPQACRVTSHQALARYLSLTEKLPQNGDIQFPSGASWNKFDSCQASAQAELAHMLAEANKGTAFEPSQEIHRGLRLILVGQVL